MHVLKNCSRILDHSKYSHFRNLSGMFIFILDNKGKDKAFLISKKKNLFAKWIFFVLSVWLVSYLFIIRSQSHYEYNLKWVAPLLNEYDSMCLSKMVYRLKQIGFLSFRQLFCPVCFSPITRHGCSFKMIRPSRWILRTLSYSPFTWQITIPVLVLLLQALQVMIQILLQHLV